LQAVVISNPDCRASLAMTDYVFTINCMIISTQALGVFSVYDENARPSFPLFEIAPLL